MPKVGFSKSDLTKGGFGMQEGNAEILNAVCKIVQYPPSPKTGKQGPPFICVQLELAHLDKDWNVMPNDEPELMEYSLGRNKIEKFHPGKVTNPGDEPEDLGSELDTEGNCIYAVDENGAIHEKTKWGTFITALQEKGGFKPEILSRGYLPDLIGTQAHFTTVKGGKFTTEEGTEMEPSILVIDKVHVYGYEKKTGSKKPTTTGKTATGTTTTSAAASSKVNGELTVNDEARTLALQVVRKVIPNLTQKQDLARPSFQKAIHNQMILDKVKVQMQKPVLELLKNDEELATLGIEAGFMLDTDANTVSVISE